MTLVLETNSSLLDYWRPVSNQFSKHISKGNYFKFFQKMRQSWTKYFATKLSRNLSGIFTFKKLGLVAKKSPQYSQNRRRGRKNQNLVFVS